MALRERARDIYIGKSIDIYWRVQRDVLDLRPSRAPTHEWKWFTANVTDVTYSSTREAETLQATLRYEPSAEFDEVSCKVTFLSNEEFKDNDSGDLFSYRLSSETSEESEEEPCNRWLTKDDEDYHPSKFRKLNRQVSRQELCQSSSWRQTLSRPQQLASERLSTSVISKLLDLERKVTSHDQIINRRLFSSRYESLQEENVATKLLRTPPIMFLAAKTLEIIERIPPPPSKISQSSKHAHKKLPHQNWFTAEAECTLQEFDNICTFISQNKKEDVTFQPSFQEFPTDIHPESEVIFHNFKTLLWVLGARSSQVVENLLLKVRYDHGRIGRAQDAQASQTTKNVVSIDVFGCLLHDDENSTNPTYIIIGEGEGVLHTNTRSLIGRPDSAWSHVEGAFAHRLQVLQVEDSCLHHTYGRWKQSMKGRTPFSLKWKGLQQQLLRSTNIFSSPGRSHILGKLLLDIPYISIREAVECKHFMDAYEEISKEQRDAT